MAASVEATLVIETLDQLDHISVYLPLMYMLITADSVPENITCVVDALPELLYQGKTNTQKASVDDKPEGLFVMLWATLLVTGAKKTIVCKII